MIHIHVSGCKSGGLDQGASGNRYLHEMPCHRAFELGGRLAGVMEAIGGIFYAWLLEGRAMQAILVEQSGVPVAEFQMAADALGQLAGVCTCSPSRQPHNHGSGKWFAT